MSSFKLLGQRRFLPFFVVQFLGALNDNVFKNALVILIAFRAASESDSGLLINLAAGLFILPFFLFSAVAGQIADKYEKSRVMRMVKVCEIAIMLVGAVGFFLHSTPLLFATLFLMGTHSAFFGPVKYSILPAHLAENELVAGNALVEMGTFLAILFGTIAGGVLAHGHDDSMLSGAVVTIAVLGFLASRLIPKADATDPGLKLNWNPVTEMKALTRIIGKKESVLNSIMGISWYWYFGATLLAQLPNFTKHFLYADESVVTLLLAVFAISIGFGSILCERLSRSEIELGLVPFGSLGMSIFSAHLFFLSYQPTLANGQLAGIHEVLFGSNAATTRWVLFDLGMIGIFSSFFIVPLYALIQSRSDAATRSRVIAANNIYNSVFMVGSALITMVLYKLEFNTIQIFLFTAILNIVVCTYIYLLIPEFAMRFALWLMASTIYKLRYVGRDQLPRTGSAVIVCNHVSFIDWFFITAACRRPARFVMDHNFFKMPVVGLLFKLAKAIPIAPAKEDAALKEKAFVAIAAALKDDNIVCIFPEGAITRDGEMAGFRPGIERILTDVPVPVIPVALCGLWGSFFSRKNGAAMSSMPKPSHRTIEVHVGKPMPPTTTAAELEAAVRGLLAN